MRVLIATAGESSRPALAAARSLGRAGARVAVCGGRPEGMAFRSRFVHERIELPDPGREPERYGDALVELVRTGRFDALLSTSEYTILVIAGLRDELARHVALAAPDPDALARVRDKWQLVGLAQAVGLGAPESHAPEDADALREVAERVRYPCILKPRSGHGAGFVSIVGSPAELLARVAAWPDVRDPAYDRRPLIQDLVPGVVHDVNVLMCHGEPRIAQTQRRVRMLPASGGPGILSETTWEPELRDAAIELMRSVGWHGPAQIEMKRDGRDGRARILDVNPRFWGTLDLAIRAGVDFPALTCRLALDGDVAPLDRYRVGLRFRWPFPHGFRYARQDARPWRAAWEFFGPARSTAWDLWPTDPLPHLAEGWRLLRRHRPASSEPPPRGSQASTTRRAL
jgi:predicted ATP-grasp superfamily ATP-dependent carboligase